MSRTLLARRSFLAILLFWAVAAASAQQAAAPQQRPLGTIVVALVEGVAFVSDAQQTRVPLAKGSVITQDKLVTTGHSSRLVLAFSNGTTLTIGADAVLSIDEFLQDPFAQAVKIGQMTAEPSKSTTRLNLRKGEIISNVKTLQKDQGSTFEIRTPVGAAGIRGTSFGIHFRSSGSLASYALRMAEGLIHLDFGSLAAAVYVPGRKQVVLRGIAFDPATNTVLSLPPVNVEDIPPAELADLNESLQDLFAITEGIGFTPNAALNPAVLNPNATAAAVQTANASSPSSFTANASPPPVSPPPGTTPAAGKR